MKDVYPRPAGQDDAPIVQSQHVVGRPADSGGNIEVRICAIRRVKDRGAVRGISYPYSAFEVRAKKYRKE